MQIYRILHYVGLLGLYLGWEKIRHVHQRVYMIAEMTEVLHCLTEHYNFTIITLKLTVFFISPFSILH